MYDGSLWRGYGEMFNLYAVQEAGQEFGILIGIKRQVYGSDGYTSFVPPDSAYDPARVAQHLRDDQKFICRSAAAILRAGAIRRSIAWMRICRRCRRTHERSCSSCRTIRR